MRNEAISLAAGPTAVVGFGLLLSRGTVDKTLGRRYEGPFVRCHVEGWRTSWNVSMPNAAFYYEEEGDRGISCAAPSPVHLVGRGTTSPHLRRQIDSLSKAGMAWTKHQTQLRCIPSGTISFSRTSMCGSSRFEINPDSNWRCTRTPRVVVPLGPYRMRSLDSAGAASAVDRRPGEVIWLDREEHEAEILIGPTHVIEIEVKSAR